MQKHLYTAMVIGPPEFVGHQRRIYLCKISCRPVHLPYSSVFSTEFNPEYGNTDLLFWLRKRSSPKYGNAHGHLNIFLR